MNNKFEMHLPKQERRRVIGESQVIDGGCFPKIPDLKRKRRNIRLHKKIPCDFLSIFGK